MPPAPSARPSEEPRTKIVCTVGPASRDVETLSAMARAGADVFRVNGAHTRGEDLADWVDRIRAAARAAGVHAAVFLDLPGTKIRVAGRPDGVRTLVAGRSVRLRDADDAPPADLPVPMDHYGAVPVGAEILLQDGQIRLVVRERGDRGLVAEVVDPGVVRRGMGVHFRGVPLPTEVPTEADRALLRAAVAVGADGVSQSFVRCPEDMVRLRLALQEAGAPGMFTIAKIERLDAVEALPAILPHADAVMVGRGDLGVDALPEHVPSLQLRILEAAARAGRPVIVATEMLESMVQRPRPTRAEATDVAAAVLQGADAVMLSGETAVGAHPTLVVATMARILAAAERDPIAPYAGRPRMRAPESSAERPDDEVVRAAVGLARDARAEAVVVFTRTGASAVRISKERPEAAIHAFAPSDEVCRRLTLAWGVRAHRLPGAGGTDDVAAGVRAVLRERLAPGARAVLVMGGPEDPAGATTTIRLVTA